jgi:hypothetical protein
MEVPIKSSHCQQQVEHTFLRAEKGSMLSGRRFRLERATLSVEVKDAKPTAFTVPVGAIVTVVSGPEDRDGMLHVKYEGRELQMFAVDVDVRGTEIIDPKQAKA